MPGPEKFVCVNCFEDPGLISFIEDHAVAEICSYCSSKGTAPIAAPIDDVSDHFIECLFWEYDLCGNQLAWDGGWVGTFYDAEELALYVIQLEFPKENQDELLPDLFGVFFDQDWCDIHGYGPNDQEWARYSWEHFRNVVMHERRYFSLNYEGDPNELSVYNTGQVLRTIFEYAQSMDLLKEFSPGSHLLRARWENRKGRWEKPEELGPPPVEKANQSNRMSPAGIPMFYGCDDDETAIKETASGPGYFAIGRFETLRPAILLDLTDIPPIPGLFERLSEGVEVHPRRTLRFLHHVASEVSRSIERDDRVHIDYVPTQVVTEFIRDQLTRNESRVDGIKYSSSVHPGHVSYVLFATQGNIVSAPETRGVEDQWLRLVEVSHR